METTKIPPTTGRIVLVHSKRFKNGPYPAMVVAAFVGASTYVNVNPSVDGANDGQALAQFRESQTGNTLTSLALYDPLTDIQRDELRASGVESWAEWMPVQAQGGGLTTRIETLERKLAAAESFHDNTTANIAIELAKFEKAIEQIRAVHTAKPGEAVAIVSPNAAGAIERACLAIEEVARHISNDGSNVLDRVQNILKV